LRPDSSSVVLLDVEGTTTPIDFVYGVLFPYARARLKDFIARHHGDAEVRAALDDLFLEHAKDDGTDRPPLPPPGCAEEARLAAITAYGQWLMEHDRKLTPLKTIQGKIWEEGYRSGELTGQVFPDVAPNLRRWREQGKKTCIYSSGSVLAQRLLFTHTTQGDLTGFIHQFFDTTVGHKMEPGSYQRIAELLGRPVRRVFISDVVGELDAAAAAGFQTLLCVRPGNRPQPDTSSHAAIQTFEMVGA
jgi:enolase-phosphatase E1